MIEITPLTKLDSTIAVPGSKSQTQRALIAASLAKGQSTLVKPLVSQDTDFLSNALGMLGIGMVKDSETWIIKGNGGKINPKSNTLYLGNNGTATRLITSVAALAHSPLLIDGDARMQERPIDPLLTALRGWEVDITSVRGTGCPPLNINSKGIKGGQTVLPSGPSSQYLSSLLLVAPYAKNMAEVKVEGEVLSKPYVALTLKVMADFGVEVEYEEDFSRFKIPQSSYQPRTYEIEGDASNASYFWAAAAVAGGSVTVSNVSMPSIQGDLKLIPLLERMGCKVRKTGKGITITGNESLQGITVDMADMPDMVPTLAVVAAFAHGKTEIVNIAHLRVKECDRLSAVVTELTKMGAKVEEFHDKMIIHGNGGASLHGAEIDTYDDHRIAMCFAVVGLRVPGVCIKGKDCVVKSFPGFWECFNLLK